MKETSCDDPAWLRHIGRDESDPALRRTVTVGELEWMTHNLNVSWFRNGDPIMEARTPEEWVRAARAGEPAWSYYNFDPANGERHGKLYNR